MKKRRYIYIALTVIVGIMAIAAPILAIANPDDIDFGTGTISLYNVFGNVTQTGDMLFVVEGYVYYAVTPTDYTASEAYLFEVLNAAGNETLLSVPLNQYGNRPISIYQAPSQVTNNSLTAGTQYILRITGNPIIFPTPVGNSVNVTLIGDDYIDQGSATTDNNPLRDFLILMAENIEDYDTPASDYIETIQGVRYLTSGGGEIFEEGIPGLQSMVPSLFKGSTEQMSSDAPTSTGAYAATLTASDKWGSQVADGLTNLGVYLGINQALAGSVVLFILVAGLAIFIYSRTQSGVTVLLMVAATPFFGAYLGLMPIALAFVFVMLIVMFMGYFFFSRGAL